MFCDYSKLVMLYKVGVVYFRLLGTNGFHVKAENEWFTVGGFTLWSEPQIRQKIARTWNAIVFLHSTNQMIDL